MPYFQVALGHFPLVILSPPLSLTNWVHPLINVMLEVSDLQVKLSTVRSESDPFKQMKACKLSLKPSHVIVIGY